MRKNIIVAICMSVILIIGCSCHKCDNCIHGSCSSNVCNCPDPYSGNNCDTQCVLGYEGYNCATYSRSKFLGVWNCTSSDPMGNSLSYQMFFTANPSDPVSMYLNNFNNKGYTILCTLTGKYKFDVQSQTSTGPIHAAVDGNALLNGSKLTLYIAEDGVDYFGTATMQ